MLGVPGAESMADIDLLNALRARIKSGGATQALLRDLREIPPEVARFDHMRFEAQITAAGAIAQQAVAVRVPQGFDFAVRRITGYIQEAAADQTPDNWARIRFQCREEGRNFDTFTSRLSMASLLSVLGPSSGFDFDPLFFKFMGGHSVEPEFDINVAATGPGAWTPSANVKVVGVVFLGTLVANRNQPAAG